MIPKPAYSILFVQSTPVFSPYIFTRDGGHLLPNTRIEGVDGLYRRKISKKSKKTFGYIAVYGVAV